MMLFLLFISCFCTKWTMADMEWSWEAELPAVVLWDSDSGSARQLCALPTRWGTSLAELSAKERDWGSFLSQELELLAVGAKGLCQRVKWALVRLLYVMEVVSQKRARFPSPHVHAGLPSHRLQLWHRSNWHWYLKTERRFEGCTGLVARWDDAVPRLLHLLTAEGDYVQVRERGFVIFRCALLGILQLDVGGSRSPLRWAHNFMMCFHRLLLTPCQLPNLGPFPLSAAGVWVGAIHLFITHSFK